MSFILLRWSVAVVLGGGAASLLVSLARVGGPVGLVALGGAELAAAALFVVPRTTRIGGLGLLAALVVATVLHAALGEAPPSSFVIAAAAVWVVMTERARTGGTP